MCVVHKHVLYVLYCMYSNLWYLVAGQSAVLRGHPGQRQRRDRPQPLNLQQERLGKRGLGQIEQGDGRGTQRTTAGTKGNDKFGAEERLKQREREGRVKH